MTVKLDITTLPTSHEENGVQLADLSGEFRAIIGLLGNINTVRRVDSFGYAIAINPNYDNWDDPSEFVTIVGGWGEDKDRYIANAVRKMRASLRESLDSLMIDAYDGAQFIDPVESQEEDGTFA